MRASRLLAILILLQLRQRLTARALADEFEVSERTIYRDVDALSAAGVPIYGDRGPGGGFQLLGDYRTKLTGLAADEAEAVMMVGLPGAAEALGIGPATRRARGKLLASLTPGSLEGAGRLGERFHLDPVDWYRAEEPVRFLPLLSRAVLDERIVTMRYESWSGVREWRIEPLGLVLKAGHWYCIGASGGRVTTFKVASILECAAEEAGFERPVAFDLAAHWRASIDRFEAELRPGRARLRATPEGLRRLAELGSYAAQAVAAADGAEVSLPVEHDTRAALALIAVGDEIEVLSPPSLRRALHELALRVAAKSS